MGGMSVSVLDNMYFIPVRVYIAVLTTHRLYLDVLPRYNKGHPSAFLYLATLFSLF